jgi:hypothetical protein
MLSCHPARSKDRAEIFRIAIAQRGIMQRDRNISPLRIEGKRADVSQVPTTQVLRAVRRALV